MRQIVSDAVPMKRELKVLEEEGVGWKRNS